MSETDDTQEQEQEMTPEEIAEAKAKAMAFYDEEIPFLKKREEYERLIADIEQHETRRLISVMKRAEIEAMGQQPPQGPPQAAPHPAAHRPLAQD